MKIKRAELSYLNDSQKIKVLEGPEITLMNEEMDVVTIFESTSNDQFWAYGAKVVFTLDRILLYGNYIKYGKETYGAAKISCFL